jgi:hypothetical protein
MRRSWALIVIGALSVLAAASALTPQQELAVLKERARTAKPADAPLAHMRVVEIEVEIAEQCYQDGEVEKGKAAVEEAVRYAELGREAAHKNSKHLKHAEIILREAGRRLEEIRQNQAFEEQAPLEKAAARLEKVRRDLLSLMFAPPK